MARHTSPYKRSDDAAFPVRVKIAVPQGGFGRALHEPLIWLENELGPGNYAHHGTTSVGGDATAFYFRDVEAARAFLSTHHSLILADGTESIGYNSPTQDAAWTSEHFLGVCNLYSFTKGQAAIRALFDDLKDSTGNLPSLPGIYPDTFAPVIRNADGGRELAMMRWGMPSPQFALKNRKTDTGITNIRNTKSPHWRRWLGVEHRCLVPFTSFSEYDKPGSGPAEPVWFALSEDRPLAFFAGVWTSWTSVRKLNEGETINYLYGFLTTDSAEPVKSIHPKAMPVILTQPEEWETWMTTSAEEAMTLQRPLSDGALEVVARGGKQDG